MDELVCLLIYMIFWLSCRIVILPYLIGSIPTGYWFAKYFFGVDVTQSGSGSIGATNVARVLGSKKYFFLILFLDFFKAFVALIFLTPVVLFKIPFGFGVDYIAASCLLIGNSHSIFMKFRGGKGVATTLGILFYFFPFLAIIFVLVFGIILFFAKRVDIASLGSVLLLIPLYFACGYGYDLSTLLFLLFIVIWVFVRHKNNIKYISGCL